MKILDLSMLIHEGMQTFATHWHPFVEITQLGRHGIEDRETRKIVMGTHTGTHIDAPRHFIKGGNTIENFSLEHLCGEACVLDFSDLPDFTKISVSMLQEKIGNLSHERVILRYDWCKRLNTNEYYTHHPYLSIEACKWLVREGCKLIAMDTPQPDNPKHGRGSPVDAPNHKILLGNDVLIVEYLVDIDQIKTDTVDLFVAPLKIKDGDGAPVRCFAVER